MSCAINAVDYSLILVNFPKIHRSWGIGFEGMEYCKLYWQQWSNDCTLTTHGRVIPIFYEAGYYRNWPRYGLRCNGLCCHSRNNTSGAGRHAETPWLATPLWWWKRVSVRMIDQCDVTIASGSHIVDVTIAQLLTFEIISGAARN